MRDLEVRSALGYWLAAQHADDPATLLVNELGIGGATRVDVVVLNGSFCGYELKSERDDLRRLQGQVAAYSKVLDMASLVVAARHHSHVGGLLPDWWGVMVAHSEAEGVVLEMDRPGGRNPSLDTAALVSLLWRDELLLELERLGLDRGVRSRTRGVMAHRLLTATEPAEIRELVRERIKAREGWRVDRVQPRDGEGFPPGATSRGSRRPAGSRSNHLPRSAKP